MRRLDRPEEQERFLVGIPEAEAMLSLGRSTLYELMDTGDLESVKVGKRRLITYSSIKAWVHSLPKAVA